MSNINIEMTLQDGELEDQPRRYQPGSAVHGWVRVTPDGTVNTNRVLVRLEWHTEGRGDRDGGSASEVVLAQGPLSAALVQPFTLNVPREPWGYAGHYINIIWTVVVVVDIPFARDARHEETIIIAPRREAPGPPSAAAEQIAPYTPPPYLSAATTSNTRALWIIGIAVFGIVGLAVLAVGFGLAVTNRHPASGPPVDTSSRHVPSPETVPTAAATTTTTATTVAVPTRPAPPKPTAATVADGTWIVAADIPAGVYRTTDAATTCFWEIRKTGTDGSNFSDVVDNQLGAGPWTVKLRAGQDFETDGCGTWTKIK
jgi:hypothetical protein